MKCLSILLFISFSFAQQSRIELRSHYSPTLAVNKEYNILFPEGYDTETDHYPVVYLFRGAVDEWADPFEDNSRRGNIKTVYDSLYAIKKVGKMILIMPGLSAPPPAIEYLYIVKDLIPFIDSTYRTIPDRWHRAMDGFSFGGLIVTNLLADAPELFGSAGSYDGTLSQFDNTKFSNAVGSRLYAIKQIQLLYHTASVGGNNNANNLATFNILNSKGIYNTLPSFLLDVSAQHNWFYADLHMTVTLPLHWKKIHFAENNLNLSLKAHLEGKTLSGTALIEWSRMNIPDMVTTDLFYSRNNGKEWTGFYSTTGNDTSFLWNTVPLPDGTRYKIKIISTGDTLFGSSMSGTFTINNPGNGAPDVEFVNLNLRDSVSGMYSLQWYAGDADGDAVNISIEVSYNAGFTWNSVATSLPNSGSYVLNSAELANGSALFRIIGSDGNLSSQSESPEVIIYNKRLNLSEAFFIHLSGNSDAILKAVAMSADALHQADYSIIFKENNGNTSYSVFNTKGIELVKNAAALDGKTEGPLFDGFRLLIRDFPTPVVNNDSTRWRTGKSTLIGDVRLIDIITEAETLKARPFASNYEIRISNSIADTSLSLYGAPALPLNFLVWNTTLNRKTKFIFAELDANGTLSEFDEIYLFEKDSLKNNILSWHIQFSANGTAVNPAAGDTFKIKIMKPLSNDAYRFIFNPGLYVINKNDGQIGYSLSQNFPNPFNPSTTIEFSVRTSEVVTLSVFDILGRRLKTLLQEKKPAGVYRVEWKADHYPSGVYFYRLQTQQFMQTRKMILTK